MVASTLKVMLVNRARPCRICDVLVTVITISNVFNNRRTRKLLNTRCSLMFLLGALLLSGCRKPAPDFQLTPTERHQTVVTVPVRVNNCDGILPKLRIYDDPFWGGGYTISNMELGPYKEPHLSIRKQLWRMYENESKGGRPVPLIVPAGAEREFTLIVSRVINRGTVTGQVIDELKIHPQQEAVYRYPIAESIVVDTYQDFSCP
jgi:hypothetical protein